MSASILDQLAELPEDDRRAYIAALEPEELDLLVHRDWSVSGRPEQFLPSGTDWLIWLIRAGRGWGKGSRVDEIVATPAGWSKLGDLVPGDKVFAPDGEPTAVAAVYDFTPERAWIVNFSDGSQVHVCGDHLWTIHDHRQRKSFNRRMAGWPVPWWSEARTLDTDTLAAGQFFGPRGDREWSIPLTAPLVGDAKHSPNVDAWCLGYWLGNGATDTGLVGTNLSDHAEVVARFRAAGWDVNDHGQQRDSHAGTAYVRGWVQTLGAARDKRVSDDWLFAPVEVRRALLAGLLDSDGHAGESHVEFVSVREDHARLVCQLARSLGERPTLNEGVAKLDGRDVGPKWRVKWSPTVSPFTLPRKSYERRGDGQRSRLCHRMIVSIEPAPIVPMRCITVDHPSHLYLIGEALIPTHNTLTGAHATKDSILELRGAGVAKVRWALLAPREDDVRTTMLEGETGLVHVLPPSMLVNGSWEDSIQRSAMRLTLATGDVIQGFSGKVPGKLRGPQHHGAWVDEPATLPDAAKGLDEDTAMSNLLFGLRLQPWNRLIITGTPRNVRLIRELREMGGMVETHGRTRDNLHNLSRTFKRVIVARYLGTRLGRQELDAEILEGVGVMFARAWFPVVEPGTFDPFDGTWERVAMWDLAATEPSDMAPDPDWTVRALVAHRPEERSEEGRLLAPPRFVVEHVARCRLNPGERDDFIKQVADLDDLPVQWFEREPGASGKSQLTYLQGLLRGIARAEEFDPKGPKGVRAELTAGPAQQGRIELADDDPHEPWHAAFLDEHEEFHPVEKLSGPHDDIVDATSAAMAVHLEQRAGTVVSAPADAGTIPTRQQRGRAVPGGIALPSSGVTMPRPSHRAATTTPRR